MDHEPSNPVRMLLTGLLYHRRTWTAVAERSGDTAFPTAHLPTPSLPYGRWGVAPFCEKTVFSFFFVNPVNPVKEIALIALSQTPAGFCLRHVGHLCPSVSSVVKKTFFCAEQTQFQ